MNKYKKKLVFIGRNDDGSNPAPRFHIYKRIALVLWKRISIGSLTSNEADKCLKELEDNKYK